MIQSNKKTPNKTNPSVVIRSRTHFASAQGRNDHMLRIISCAALLTLVCLGVTACATEGGSSGGAAMQNTAPAGGGY
jgi:hypothetical protein